MAPWPSGGTGEMFRLIDSLPEQLTASAELKGLSKIGPIPADINRVLLCGMGGSAIAADLVQPLLQHQSLSLEVWRNYGLPHWVDEQTLIIAASYSGNTEESLSALAEARMRRCSVVGITSGGQLQQAAEGHGGEAFPWVQLPGGLPPRASLGFGLGALVRILGKLGLVNEADEEIQVAIEVLQELNPARLAPLGQDTNTDTGFDPAGMISARGLADKLIGAVPVVYTSDLESHGAGVRLKGQINENSKSPVCLAVFPELNHNDLVGWELEAPFQGRFVLLILEGTLDNERLAARVDITRELLAGEFSEIHRIKAQGTRVLARVLSLVQYGDYLSCHLAHLKGVDPVPVDRIGTLKNRLEKL